MHNLVQLRWKFVRYLVLFIGQKVIDPTLICLSGTYRPFNMCHSNIMEH